jgi:hypothetical protein
MIVPTATGTQKFARHSFPRKMSLVHRRFQPANDRLHGFCLPRGVTLGMPPSRVCQFPDFTLVFGINIVRTGAVHFEATTHSALIAINGSVRVARSVGEMAAMKDITSSAPAAAR